MIIFEDLTWQANSDYPDTDYTVDQSAKYVIPDSSDLASIVRQYAPNIEIIVDETGNVIDIEKHEDVELIKLYKCQEINTACNATIKQGVEYNGEHFDLTEEDQINILAWSSIAQSGQPVPYHSSGNPCRVYTAEEFLGLVSYITAFKTQQLTYCNLLKQQVKEMTDIEEVKAVVYGQTELNEKYAELFAQLSGASV